MYSDPVEDFYYKVPLNQKPKDDTNNPNVKSAIFTMANNRDTKIERDNKNLMIQRLYEAGFEIKDPNGTRKISSKMLQQVFWRGANRMKPLSAEIFGTGRPDINRKIVTAGVRTIMDRGGFTAALRDKEGAFQKLLMWGDGFVQFGTNPYKSAAFPLLYTPVSNSNIYVDAYSTGIRTGGLGRSTRRCVVVFSMSWDDACAYDPQIAKKCTVGKVPRDTGFYKELERTYIQSNKLENMIEIAHSYDLDNMSYVRFAGPTCGILEELEGKDYPFTKGEDKDPYIPILQFICQPSTEGFYNHGLADMIYDIAVMAMRLDNMGYGHAEDGAYPYTLVNVPKGQAAEFFNSMQSAGEMRAKGKKPIIPIEYDPANPNSGRVSAEALTTQNMLNELEAAMGRLDKEVSRLGINLDDLDYGSDLTASQVMAQDQNSNSLFQQVGETNASTYQFAIESAMDILCKTVTKNDKTPLNISTQLEDADGTKIKIDEITLGAVVDELKKYNYYVEVDSRSGVFPSNLMENVQISNLLRATPPGTPAQFKLLEQFAGVNNRNMSAKEFQMGPPPGAEGQQGGGPELSSSAIPMGAQPTQTDRLVVSPTGRKNPVAAF